MAYLLRRVGLAVLVFLSVTGVAYLLYYLRGGEAIARTISGVDATEVDIELTMRAYGLDRPLGEQYLDWLTGLFRGDFGTSFSSGREVSEILAARLPVTLSLTFATLALMIVFGLILGVLAAIRGGIVDRVVQGLSVVLGALPGYWLALILVIVFALNLRLLPATGFVSPAESLTGWIASITLPAVAIALGGTFGLAVWIRSSIIDMRRQDWVRTLRSRGLSPRTIMYRHVLRNAAAPTVQIIGLQLIGLLGGTIIVERIFNLSGLGSMALNAGQHGDIPVVLGGVTVFVLVVVGINFLVDVANGLLNPKVRTR